MTAQPDHRVSVVMPVFNGRRFLPECIESVLGQTYQDFEFIIVDDGSSDESWDLLQGYAARDARIKLHRHDVNKGHDVASNEALKRSTGEFIARQDQDDVWLPRRLEASVSWLDAHPAVGLLGTAYVRAAGEERVARGSPTSHTAIRVALLFDNAICHAAVTVRRSLAATGELRYRPVPGPQDYDLWVRLLAHTRAASIPEPLVVYRVQAESMTTLFSDGQPGAVEAISARQLRGLLGDLDIGCLRSLRRLVSCRGVLPQDYTNTALLLGAFDRLKSWPDLDTGELDALRRRWIVRAATTSFAQRSSARVDQKFFRAVLRHDPGALAAWIGSDLPPRVLRRLRRA